MKIRKKPRTNKDQEKIENQERNNPGEKMKIRKKIKSRKMKIRRDK